MLILPYLDDLNSTKFNNNILYSKNSFEIAVKSQDRMRVPGYRYFNPDYFNISEHNIEFSITKASPQYIVSLLCFYAMVDERSSSIPLIHHVMIRKDDINSIDILSDLFRILTVRISSQADISIQEFKKMLQSYLFNISYNTNVVFTISDLLEEQQPLRRGARRDGQLFPYKSYNQELTKYYFQGLSTDIPFTQYLAFYHVAEFFFQTIAEQEAFQEIEAFITRPSFSPHSKDDIKQFYNKIKKKIREQRDDGVWEEKTGLLLCLKKFIPDIDVLKKSIVSIDISAIEYYKNNNASFADEASAVNFDIINDETYAVLRNRIYSVRNAIVHSKDGEKSRYEPFKHDKELSKEIPLIRAVAEEIIINSSKALDIKM